MSQPTVSIGVPVHNGEDYRRFGYERGGVIRDM
jgi:hypothetical protein